MIHPLKPCSEACPGHDARGEPCPDCWRGEVLAPAREYYWRVSKCLACRAPTEPGYHLCAGCDDRAFEEWRDAKESERD